MDMKDANAQKQAFAETWSNYEYVDTLNEIAELHKDLYQVLNMFHNLKVLATVPPLIYPPWPSVFFTCTSY